MTSIGVPNVQAATPATAPASITPLQSEGHGETLVLNKALAVFEKIIIFFFFFLNKEEEIATCSALEAGALQQVGQTRHLPGAVQKTLQ